MEFLKLYENSSGQKVNPSKSNFLISKNAPSRVARSITRITGFRQQLGTITYLGVPLRQGKSLVADYKPLIEKVSGRIGSWSSRLLSQAGRVTLINSVLCSIPVYLAAAASIPKSTINYIECLCVGFLWGSSEGRQRRHWVPWNVIQRPILEGGLGVRSIWHVQLSLAVKLLWSL